MEISSFATDALAIVRRYGIELPAHVLQVLSTGSGESVKPSDPRLAGVDTRMVAAPQQALEAAAAVARPGANGGPRGGGGDGGKRRLPLFGQACDPCAGDAGPPLWLLQRLLPRQDRG